MKSLEHKFPPPLVAIVIGAAMWGVTFLLSPIQLAPLLHYGLSGLIGVFSLLVAGAGMWAFRQAKTTINPVQIDAASSVVKDGIFRYTRNPMYVGLTAALTCWAVYLAVPWTLLGPVVFALFIHRFQVLPEERVMSARFGREYDEYRLRVRRWV